MKPEDFLLEWKAPDTQQAKPAPEPAKPEQPDWQRMKWIARMVAADANAQRDRKRKVHHARS
jgi:hypothetical protein